jgi:T-lymphoma invasion and metastasis-inducing protein 1
MSINTVVGKHVHWTCLPTTVLMDMFTYYCIDGHVYLLLYWWTCLPTTVLMDMFTYYCIDGHVYLLLYWWTCLPTTVLMDMFTYYCIDGHVYLLLYWWTCLPTTVFFDMFNYYCIDVNFYLLLQIFFIEICVHFTLFYYTSYLTVLSVIYVSTCGHWDCTTLKHFCIAWNKAESCTVI